MPFLSLLDDRAKPKGSRDPLGFELVWSHFGRKVIGNLTTITSSMDNFAVALLGFHLANESADSKIEEPDKHKKIRESFLRYEQLTGYIRYFGNAEDIMGITRIKGRMSAEVAVSLGQSADQQILSNQAAYGLWGLYSSAARESDLISGNDRVLTEKGRLVVDEIIRQLGADFHLIKKQLSSNRALDKTNLGNLAKPLMNAIQHEKVQKLLLKALMSGQHSGDVQSELWGITQEIFKPGETIPNSYKDFIIQVLEHTPSEKLKRCIDDINHIERLLVAVNNIFHYCRRKNGKLLEKVVKKLNKKSYDYSFLPKTLPHAKFTNNTKLSSILDAFHANDNDRVVREILQLNKDVMRKRNGAAWVEIEGGKTIRVKVVSEVTQLRSQSDLEVKWDYDYFLGSFFYIAQKQLSKM